jgi:hypothetical protein
MNWTWQEIESDWLRGSHLALPPEGVVAAFDRVGRAFGREWIEASRLNGGNICRGTYPTLRVVITSHLIAALEGLQGAAPLLESLRQNNVSASAEAIAIHLLRTGRPDIIVELFPTVKVGKGERQPDLRAQEPGGVWTYIEVTQADVSEAEKRVQAVMQRLTDLLDGMKKGLALEVYLRREPTDSELEALAAAIPGFCALDGKQKQDLPDGLGQLLLNESEPGVIDLQKRDGEQENSMLCRTTTIGGGSEPHRHICVRMAYADMRGQRFLEAEARQLPTEHPGLIVVLMARAHGGMKTWEPIFLERFNCGFHTRVSAVCLVEGGCEGTAEGEAWLLRTKLVTNPKAAQQLPTWVGEALKSFLPPHGSPHR